MKQSKIEWTDRVWNPVRGCALVSAGCTNCYAMRQAHRFSSGAGQPYHRLTKMTSHGPTWTGKAVTVPDMLARPLHWRKPSRVFVNSMSDLFHEDVPFKFIDSVFGIMLMTPQHTYQILTKRPERMREYMQDRDLLLPVKAAAKLAPKREANSRDWPPKNVWLGVSVESQATADQRIPILLDTPAAVRWLSCEPLLEAVDLRRQLETQTHERDAPAGYGVSWAVVGGESGPNARPFDVAWARQIARDCKAAGVPVFVKQLGAVVHWDGVTVTPVEGWPAGIMVAPVDGKIVTHYEGSFRVQLDDTKGGDPREWPADLRVREYPRATA